MAEKNYDVWNDGFLGSGFEEESANALRLASERAVCSVRRDPKKKGEIAVSLCLRGESSGSKEIARCALPDKAVDFFDFSMQLAKGLFETRRLYAPFGREVLPRDLADLVENGFDYLGDDSANAVAPDEPTPESDDGFDALVARLSRVIGAAREASDEQIHAATKAHDYAKGGKAMERSTRLQTLQELLDDFAAKWKAEVREALTRAMAQKGYSAKKLAQTLNLKRGLVKGWCDGRGRILPEQRVALRRLLGVEGL